MYKVFSLLNLRGFKPNYIFNFYKFVDFNILYLN